MSDCDSGNGLIAWIQMPSGFNSIPNQQYENLPASEIDYSPNAGSSLSGQTTVEAAIDAIAAQMITLTNLQSSLATVIQGQDPGQVRTTATGALESVAFPTLTPLTGLIYRNNWQQSYALSAQVAPKIFDVYFAALKSRSLPIANFETIVELPWTSIAPVFGNPFDSGILRLETNRFMFQGLDANLSNGVMRPPSQVSYGYPDAQWVLFNGRVYVA